MKKLLLIWGIIFTFLFTKIAFAQQQLNLPLLSNWKPASVSPPNYYNDCWGYVDSLGREYAIIGSDKGTYFLNITNPASPVLISFQPGKDNNAIHRDYKTYKKYCYAVCDEGNSSLQIFDLSNLPLSVVKVYDSDSLSKKCHNIFISDDKLFLAGNTIVSSSTNQLHAMDVLSLANPIAPSFISTISNPYYIHDVYVRNDTAFCSAGNNGLFVFDYKNASSPQLMMSITNYQEQGYNHSNWVTKDAKHIVWADETPGKALKLYDISNFSNPSFVSLFRSNLLNVLPANSSQGSTPHNPYIVGDRVIISYYHDGVQIFDISNPLSPKRIAYYDTHPLNTDYNGFQGCWGVYPFFPSGSIIASDIVNGLFVFNGSLVLGIDKKESDEDKMIVYPNPTSEIMNIQIENAQQDLYQYYLTDISGKIILQGVNNFNDNKSIELNMKGISKGMYLIRLESEKQILNKKIIIN